LNGLRAPLLALFLSVILLAAVVMLRLSESPIRPQPTATLATQSLPSVTPLPLLSNAELPAALPPRPAIAALPVEQGVLREALIAPSCVLKLNPLLAGFNQADRDVTALIFEGLMKTDAYGNAVPSLAASLPRISNDGLTYVFTLREDVRWHDGEPFTSADVIFTISLMQAEDFSGAPDLRNFWRTVEVDALNAQTVRFKLAQPLAAFPDYLRIGILPEHALRGVTGRALATHPFNLNPIGTGAYQFERLLSDGVRLRGVRLRAAPTFAARPEAAEGYALRQLDLICYPTWDEARAAFERGEVNSLSDVPSAVVQSLKALPLTLYTAYKPAVGAIIYNWASDSAPFFRDVRFRQALARSVDRAALVTQFMADRAVVANTPVLPSSWAYAPEISCPSYDPSTPEAAARSLAQVQITPPPESDPSAPESAPPAQHAGYRFQLLLSDDAAQAALGQAVAEAWRALGLGVDVVVVDRATFRERLANGSFEAALVELDLAPSADPDPYSLWRQVPSEGGLNFGRLNDRRISELLEAARQTTDGSARVALYTEFQRLFCDRAAALVLYYPIYYYGVDARLSGVQLGFVSQPADRFRTLGAWRWSE
jgi:peptide/nickel transport system substrate-binding protein